MRLPDAVNQSTSVYAPSVVADGSLYFMVASPEKGRFRVVRSQLEGGNAVVCSGGRFLPCGLGLGLPALGSNMLRNL